MHEKLWFDKCQKFIEVCATAISAVAQLPQPFLLKTIKLQQILLEDESGLSGRGDRTIICAL